MFNSQLHRRLDAEKESEICIRMLEGAYRELQNVISWKGWDEDDGLRYVLAAGVRALTEWKTPRQSLDEMTEREKLQFLQDRLSSVEAAYSTLKFQAYQVMVQNDALDMNICGLMPQLEAAVERVQELEDEIRRLRVLVPENQRQGKVLVREPASSEPDNEDLGQGLGGKLRQVFGMRGR